MVDFVALAITVKRLIDGSGRPITLVKLNQGATDSSKPWRGLADPRATPAATASGNGVFVDPSSLSELGIQASGDKRVDKIVMFAANDDGGENLLNFDELVDDTERWKIVKVQLLQPGATKLLYFFEVGR